MKSAVFAYVHTTLVHTGMLGHPVYDGACALNDNAASADICCTELPRVSALSLSFLTRHKLSKAR